MKHLKKFGICLLCLLLACSMVLMTACKKDTADGPEDAAQEANNGDNENQDYNRDGDEQPRAEEIKAAAIAQLVKQLADESATVLSVDGQVRLVSPYDERQETITLLWDLIGGNMDERTYSKTIYLSEDESEEAENPDGSGGSQADV